MTNGHVFIFYFLAFFNLVAIATKNAKWNATKSIDWLASNLFAKETCTSEVNIFLLRQVHLFEAKVLFHLKQLIYSARIIL